MNSNQWMVETHGDPLGSVRHLISVIWNAVDLDCMMVTSSSGNDINSKPQIISQTEALDNVNPFKPIMTMNTAGLVPKFLENHPKDTLGILFRPCEMRSLIEMRKHTAFSIENLITICVDCLGTLPLEDYSWRSERRGGSTGLTDEALQFSRQGGILAFRYRSACQMCASPGARHADVNINVIGLPARKHILINVNSSQLKDQSLFERINGEPAENQLVEQHERVLFKLTERHQHTMERLFETLSDYLPDNVDAVVQQLDNCTDCQSCLNTCPICEVNQPSRDDEGHFSRNEIIGWLISCSGCGMCEQACPDHLPLSSIFGYVRERLNAEYNYHPGRSPNDSLPIL